MKKIVVFGDIHGNTINLMKIVHEIEAANHAVFLGDGVASLEVLPVRLNKKIIAVKGNCDFFCALPNEQIIEIEGIKIFITHGSEYGVKQGLGGIAKAAKDCGAEVCLFGHSHIADNQKFDNIMFVNPGTLGTARTLDSGRYAIITVNNSKIDIEHKKV